MLIFTKMRKNLKNEIEIPEGIEVKFEEGIIYIKGPEGENSRKLSLGKINLKIENSKIILNFDKATKKEKKQMNTITAHLKNLIKGVKEKFEYTLKICKSHFPFTLKIENNFKAGISDIILKR